MCTDAYRAALARSFAKTAAAPLGGTPEPGRRPKAEDEADREAALGGSALGKPPLGGSALGKPPLGKPPLGKPPLGGSALGGADGLDRQ